jgi:hypothetical protein
MVFPAKLELPRQGDGEKGREGKGRDGEEGEALHVRKAAITPTTGAIALLRHVQH